MSGRRLKAERRKAFGRVGEPQTPEQAENLAIATALRSGSEMALRNDYAVRATDPRDADMAELGTEILARVGSADVVFTAPPGVDAGNIFGINAASYDLWSGNAYEFHQPGPVTPIRNAGTKARAVRLRGMVGVLQDSLHLAGVWPWLDGRRFVSKPWELAMEGLLASIERQGREQDSRTLATRRNVPPGMENRYRIVDVNRDTSTITIATANPVVTGITITDTFDDSPFIPTADMVVSLAPVPTAERKKHRYTPPPRRLDGRR